MGLVCPRRTHPRGRCGGPQPHGKVTRISLLQRSLSHSLTCWIRVSGDGQPDRQCFPAPLGVAPVWGPPHLPAIELMSNPSGYTVCSVRGQARIKQDTDLGISVTRMSSVATISSLGENWCGLWHTKEHVAPIPCAIFEAKM